MGTAGRKTKYEKKMPQRVYQLCLLGLQDKELCLAFGISHQTIDNWKNEHPEFYQAILRGREHADSKVAEALYKKALGYSHKDVHITNYQGEITKTPIIKYYPPDTIACIFWLRNRQRDYWKDVRQLEHTGAGGKPIDINLQVDLKDFSDEELNMMERMGMKLNGKGNGHCNRLSPHLS